MGSRCRERALPVPQCAQTKQKTPGEFAGGFVCGMGDGFLFQGSGDGFQKGPGLNGGTGGFDMTLAFEQGGDGPLVARMQQISGPVIDSPGGGKVAVMAVQNDLSQGEKFHF